MTPPTREPHLRSRVDAKALTTRLVESLKVDDDHWSLAEEHCGQQTKTQVGRARDELELEASNSC